MMECRMRADGAVYEPVGANLSADRAQACKPSCRRDNPTLIGSDQCRCCADLRRLSADGKLGRGPVTIPACDAPRRMVTATWVRFISSIRTLTASSSSAGIRRIAADPERHQHLARENLSFAMDIVMETIFRSVALHSAQLSTLQRLARPCIALRSIDAFRLKCEYQMIEDTIAARCREIAIKNFTNEQRSRHNANLFALLRNLSAVTTLSSETVGSAKSQRIVTSRSFERNT
nr:hypothetical protein CFP56_09648 [Quercus suber]